VWTPIAAGLYGKGGAVWWPVAVAIVAVGVYLRRQSRVVYAVGLATSAAALVAAWFTFILTGCRAANGHVDNWMWAAGVAVIAAGCAAAVLRPRHLFWALPVATYVGLAITDVLAVTLNGATGWCLD